MKLSKMENLLNEEARPGETILWSESPKRLRLRAGLVSSKSIALIFVICIMVLITLSRSDDTSLLVMFMALVGVIIISCLLAISSIRSIFEYAENTIYGVTAIRVISINSNPRTNEILVASVKYKNIHKLFNIGKGQTRTVRLQLDKKLINPAIFDLLSVARADELNALIIKYSPNLAKP